MKDVERSGRGLTDDGYMKELKKRQKARSEQLVPPANVDSHAIGGKIAVFKNFRKLSSSVC